MADEIETRVKNNGTGGLCGRFDAEPAPVSIFWSLAKLIRDADERAVRALTLGVAARTEGRMDLLRAWAQRGGLLPRKALLLAKACYRLGIKPKVFPKVRRQLATDRAV